MEDLVPVPTEVWFPVVTLGLGYAAKSATDWLQDRRHAAREAASRSETRRHQILLRRADFQRQTLLELQDAAKQLTRKTAQICFAYKAAQQSGGGEWGEHPLPPELDESVRESRATISLLRVRVRDARIVHLTDELLTAGVECSLANSEEAAFSKFGEASEHGNQLNDRIGEILKELDDIEDRELREA
jgi:hypothetical protein